MKKIFISIVVVLIICCGCSAKAKNKFLNKSDCTQPGSYFTDGEDRFVLVDESYQEIGNHTHYCRVFADKYMLTMYLLTDDLDDGYNGGTGMTQLFYEDGSPMIYDDVTLMEELYSE